jgi:hypothetical protein
MHMTGKYAVPVAPDGSDGNGDDAVSFTVQLEGNFPNTVENRPKPYDVPYRMMVPKKGTGENLLVPVCLSTSHAAFASTRIETMLMGTGSAAGVAAQQLVDGSARTVQGVNVSKVQAILSGVFGQTIHVGGEPPSGPIPKYYNVTGAGGASWNGQYVHTGSAFSAPLFTKKSSDHALYRDSGAWRLAIKGTVLAYTASGPGKDGGLPPLANWLVASGHVAPAPALLAGPSTGSV